MKGVFSMFVPSMESLILEIAFADRNSVPSTLRGPQVIVMLVPPCEPLLFAAKLAARIPSIGGLEGSPFQGPQDVFWDINY